MLASRYSTPSDMAMSTYWPRPVRSRAISAARMPNAACMPPPAKSAMMFIGIAGGVSGQPIMPSAPPTEM